MTPNPFDKTLIAAIADGLPLSPTPYLDIAHQIGASEKEVTECLRRLMETGVINRFGVIVRHHEMGYRANAMVVWDVADDEAGIAGRILAGLSYVSLSYLRPRRLPEWPYNLFCMIHGKHRGLVEDLVEQAAEAAGLQDTPSAILFSGRRFKQRGARYGAPAMVAAG